MAVCFTSLDHDQTYKIIHTKVGPYSVFLSYVYIYMYDFTTRMRLIFHLSSRHQTRVTNLSKSKVHFLKPRDQSL